jgi:hypothetical protein
MKPQWDRKKFLKVQGEDRVGLWFIHNAQATMGYAVPIARRD